MLASWEELESYGFDIDAEVDISQDQEIPPSTSLMFVLNGEHAEELQNATKLIMPDNITSIATCAFFNCTGLNSIKIPNSVTSIGYLAFYGCTALTSFEISDSVASIGLGAFSGCDLTSISVNENNAVYDSRGNCNAIIETATNILIAGSNNTIIPDDITSIAPYAFYGCTGLDSIEIPDSVTNIGLAAFYGCTGLNSIEIPDSVTIIGPSAFCGCTGLTSIKISDNLTTIEEYALGNCSGLTSIILPNTMTKIGESAFYKCINLTKINYKGTREEWETINFGPNWSEDCPATIVYNYTD